MDEFEYIAPDATAEAVVELAVGINAERGGFFVVKRAEAGVVAALLDELDVFGDQVDDVGGVADALEDVLRGCAALLAGGFFSILTALLSKIWRPINRVKKVN